MPKALVSRPVEAPAWHRVPTSATSPPHSYCPGSFPRRRIAPVSRRPRNVIPGEWTAVRVTAGCHRSASKVAGVPAGPGGKRKPASYARKGLRVLSARRVPEAIA